MSPARKRAQRRANNQSPRRKGEPSKGASEENDENPKKKKSNKSKTLSNYDGRNHKSPRIDIYNADHNAKEQAIPSKMETEKESIDISVLANNDALIKHDKIVDGSFPEKHLKIRNEETNSAESKPSNTKIKVAKSPRRAKSMKVCKQTLSYKWSRIAN